MSSGVMMSRDKMFIIADNIDDSIKSQTSVYDIQIFKSFTDFERYIDKIPSIINTLVISESVLPFIGQNMTRVMQVLNSPFLTIEENVVYLIDKSTDYKIVNKFIEDMNLKNWAVYQGDLSVRFITDIVVGTGRQTTECINEVVTYRIRSSEYIKQQTNLQYEDNSAKYFTDEDILRGVQGVEEPEDVCAVTESYTSVNYIVGDDCVERTLMVMLLAQYLCLQGKTIILEKDSEYHMLGELLTKSPVDYEYITIESISDDISSVLKTIRTTKKNLIYIGTTKRYKYDYNFLLDVLTSNLKDSVAYIIRECSFEETPYGKRYTIVTPNNIPAILKCCNSLKYDINAEDVTFVGLQASNLGPVNITSKEMSSIIKAVLNKDKISAQVVYVNGISLKGENVVYDILSILNRGNRG